MFNKNNRLRAPLNTFILAVSFEASWYQWDTSQDKDCPVSWGVKRWHMQWNDLKPQWWNKHMAEWGAELQTGFQAQRDRHIWPNLWAPILSIVGMRWTLRSALLQGDLVLLCHRWRVVYLQMSGQSKDEKQQPAWLQLSLPEDSGQDLLWLCAVASCCCLLCSMTSSKFYTWLIKWTWWSGSGSGLM